MAGLKTIPATKLSEIHTSAQEELGTLRVEQGTGRIFQYVEFDQNSDASAGEAVVWRDPANYLVTTDTTGNGNGRALQGAGVVHVANTASTDSENKFGWIMVKGPRTENDLVDASNGVSDNAAIVADDSNDGEFRTMAAGEEDHVMGYADAAASGGTFSGYLMMR